MLTRLERRLQGLSPTRFMRRLAVAAYVFSLLVYLLTSAVYLLIGRGTTRFYGLASFVSIVSGIVISATLLRTLRRANLATTRDERAQLDFGQPYARLSAMHRFDVGVRIQRELRSGGRPPDERDTLLQRQAERQSLAILRVFLPSVVLAFWIIALLLPPTPLRNGLLIGALVASAMLVPIFVLPDLIRLWSEPDPAPEPNLLSIQPEA